MAIMQIRTLSFEELKRELGVTTLSLRETSKGFRITNGDTILGSCGDDFDHTKPILAMEFMDTATTRKWWFFINPELGEVVATL